MVCNMSMSLIVANGLCVCADGFENIAGACTEICGDGRLFGSGCDDGNLENGDGCD